MGSVVVHSRELTQCLQLCPLELLMPQQRLATSVEGVEVIVDMEDTEVMVDMDIMERDQLKLMLSQDMEDMAIEVMEGTDMDVDTMAREKQMLNQLLKLMLSQDI